MKRDYIYGVNPAFEVLLGSKRQVFRAHINTGSSGTRIKRLLALLERDGIEVIRSDRHHLFELCGTKEHQGVVVETEPYPCVSFSAFHDRPRVLLIDNIEDPQNLGAILRSAEIFGWNSVVVPSKGSPGIYASVVKASAGATEHIDIAADHSANHYARSLSKSGHTLAVLDSRGKTGLDEISGSSIDRLLLVVGGEDRSVGQFILNMADHVIRIDQVGKVSSLNASVAAGIALHSLADWTGGRPENER